MRSHQQRRYCYVFARGVWTAHIVHDSYPDTRQSAYSEIFPDISEVFFHFFEIVGRFEVVSRQNPVHHFPAEFFDRLYKSFPLSPDKIPWQNGDIHFL